MHALVCCVLFSVRGTDVARSPKEPPLPPGEAMDIGLPLYLLVPPSSGAASGASFEPRFAARACKKILIHANLRHRAVSRQPRRRRRARGR